MLEYVFSSLAFRFSVRMSIVSCLFSQTIEVLYIKLRHLIVWPDRDLLLYTMPMCYRKHCPTCVAIIDCFEVFIDRLTNFLARAQTYSAYKHHNTVKYLIGITPQGTVSFISKGWGGRVSDKHLTLFLAILCLLTGDLTSRNLQLCIVHVSPYQERSN